MANDSHVMPRYVLAKYVPDLSRMEPRNVGVVLWANGQIAARFLPKSEAPFVGDLEAYEWWIATWQDAIASEAIRPKRGRAVSKSDHHCIDALLTRQEDNYLLVDAGELLESIGKRELSDAVNFLFGDLVAQSGLSGEATSGRRTSSQLRDYCSRIFQSTGLADRPDYHEGLSLECPVYGVKKHLKFNHVIGNGAPNAVFQQANLHSQQSVNSSALMLHAITDSATVPKARCAALTRESDINSEASEEGVALLAALCRVIFVDANDADEQILDVALNGDVRARVGAKRSKRT